MKKIQNNFITNFITSNTINNEKKSQPIMQKNYFERKVKRMRVNAYQEENWGCVNLSGVGVGMIRMKKFSYLWFGV